MMTSIEIFGVIFGLLSIYYTIREKILCWPTGIVNIALFFILFLDARLYADMGLQAVFFILSVYGWYEWLHGGEKKSELAITRIEPREWGAIAAILAAGTAGLGCLLVKTTDASIPFWDSAASVMSVMAQYLLAKKKLENYLIWVAVDILSIGIYFYKGLYLTGSLFIVYLILATAGYFSWRKKFHASQPV